MKEESKKKKILRISGLIGLFLLVFGLSYALFTVTLNGTKKVKIKTGKLELQLLDSNNNPIYITDQNNTTSYEINIDNQVPVSDEVGLDSAAFEFKLKNSGNLKASYTIYLDDVALNSGESRIDDQYIRYSLTKNGSEENPQSLSSRELDKGTIEADNTTNEYTLKIWIAEDASNEAMDKVFNATLRVEGTQYTPLFKEGTFASTLYNKGIVAEKNNFSSVFDINNEESGLYKYTDSYNKTTYVYRGPDVQNYVSFAGQLWRILRIQDNGTVKLIREEAINYENTEYDQGSTVVDENAYRYVYYNKENNSNDNNMYKGSNIEGYVNAWYEDEMGDYDNKIALNEYCSDRTENNVSYMANWIDSVSPLYGVYNRLIVGEREDLSSWIFTPSVSCEEEDTINSKAALITADEYTLAGPPFSQYEFGENNYLKKQYYYWTMSPGGYKDNKAMVYAAPFNVFMMLFQVNMVSDADPDNYAPAFGLVRPVITLKSNVSSSSGDGTSEHPYVIS